MDTQQPDSSALKQAPESSAQDGSSSSQQVVLDILKRDALLARKGEYVEAENLLEPLCNNDNLRIEAIDLLAKVYAQQGKINQAQALWLKALQRDPSNIHFLSALRMCAYYKKSRFEHFILQHLWLLISIVLWFIVSMILIINMSVSG